MRAALVSLFLVIFATMPASAGELDAEFLIKRKDKVIGFHRVSIEENGEEQTVTTTIRMKVKFGPIVVFRYTHLSVEEWRDGMLISLASTTDRNGKEMFARAQRTEDGIEIEGTKFTGAAPFEALPSSYWNKALIESSSMFNSQHGEVMDIVVSSLGVVEAEHGAPAEKYELASETNLYLWYDGPRWVGAEFTIDGEALVYELADSAKDFERTAKYAD